MTFAFTVTPQLMISGIIYGLFAHLHRWHPAGHPGGEAAHHGGSARIVNASLDSGGYGALASGRRLFVCCGGAGPHGLGRRRRPHPVRVLHQRRARAERLLSSLKPKAVEGETRMRPTMRRSRHYFRALTHYRLAQVLAGDQEIAGQGCHRRLRR